MQGLYSTFTLFLDFNICLAVLLASQNAFWKFLFVWKSSPKRFIRKSSTLRYLHILHKNFSNLVGAFCNLVISLSPNEVKKVMHQLIPRVASEINNSIATTAILGAEWPVVG